MSSVHRNLVVLDAAQAVGDEINALLNSALRWHHAEQLRASVQSVVANIAEGFGRGPGAERGHFLRIARGSAEESIRHLRANLGSPALADGTYWRLHNRLVAISRMIDGLQRHPSSTTRPKRC